MLSANSALGLASAITLAGLLVAAYSVVGGLLADAVTDVVQGLYIALWNLTEPGDGAVVQTPVGPQKPSTTVRGTSCMKLMPEARRMSGRSTPSPESRRR